MNLLKVITKPTLSPDEFIVYWTNYWLSSPAQAFKNAPKGSILVRVPLKIDDKAIVAEMVAMKFLLEEKQAIGPNIAGNSNMELITSSGAIKKLRSKRSSKEHLRKFANFLQTRFHDAPIKVDTDGYWVEGYTEEPTDTLVASYENCEEKIQVYGVGDVTVTSHVLERFAERLNQARKREYDDRLRRSPAKEHSIPNPVSIGDAWRTIRKLVAYQGIKQISVGSAFSKMKHKNEGRHYYHPTGWVFVVTDNPNSGRSLVTTFFEQDAVGNE